MKREAPAASRNTAPIQDVLQRVLPASGLTLEVACGTGQHAVAFATAFPNMQWQPSDCDPAALASTVAWRADAGLANLLSPIELDASAESWPIERADAVVCINMIHISPWRSCEGLLAGAGRILPAGGRLIVYGPFIVPGVATAPSNLAFDQSLRQRDPRWGLRDLHEVTAEAARHSLELIETQNMPANNLSAIFERR